MISSPRFLFLASLCVSLLAALSACGDAPATLPARPPVLHMLADADHVELLEGFGGYTSLEVWNDLEGRNPDRDEILLRIARPSKLRWQVHVPGGSSFHAGLVRLPFGTGADEGECRVALRLLDAQGGVISESDIPLATVAAEPDARADNWREGPSPAQVHVTTSVPVATLELSVSSSDVPPNALVGLLSPRFVVAAPRVPLSERPIAWPEHSRRLMSRLEVGEQESAPLATWRTENEQVAAERAAAGRPNSGTDHVEPLRETGAFLGHKPRHALGFLDDAVATWRESNLGGFHLRGAVALDARMPAGAAGDFVVRIDGQERARVPVRSTHWESVDLDLGIPRDDRGEHRLEITLEGSALLGDEARVQVPDFVSGTFEQRLYRAQRLRAGFAEPRLESPWGEQAREVASHEHPSLLLIHAETLRADVLGGEGVPADLTPNLARLASAGVSYTQAVSPSSWTLPSSATLFTGLSPSSHGVVRHDRGALPDAAVTLAERLRAAGWVTGGMVTNTLLNGHTGWSRGFVDWLELPYLHMRQVGAMARDWVAAQGDARWFLFLHPFDPHGPHNAPAEFRDQFVEPDLRDRDFKSASDAIIAQMRALQPLDPSDPNLRYLRQRYFGDVAYLDRELDRLLDALDAQGALAHTALVFTADHGEEFGEHGLWGHGSNLMGPATRVPLLIVPPGALAGWSRGAAFQEGAEVHEQVSTDGLHATLLGLLDIEARANLRPALGEQLRNAPAAWLETDKAPAIGVIEFSGEPAAEGELAPTRPQPGDPLRRWARAVRTGEHLLVRSFPLPREVDPDSGAARQAWDEFWELSDTPGGERALPLEGAVYEQLSGYLEAQQRRSLGEALRGPEAGAGMDQLEALAALGYLQASEDAPSQKPAVPSAEPAAEEFDEAP
ncbi:MAG: hypothetical protein DHS20C15_17190 [Planctomycetota bacterium]|nr:MAG: hypothetical protein DHS20C15_17190 [Planctomycetota bacterium]